MCILSDRQICYFTDSCQVTAILDSQRRISKSRKMGEIREDGSTHVSNQRIVDAVSSCGATMRRGGKCEPSSVTHEQN